MKHTIGYALIVFAAMTTASVANSGTNATSPRIDGALHGHGSTGETTKSASKPDVPSQVLDNGDIENSSSAYNRVEAVSPSSWQVGSPRQRASWAGR
ncbi:MAG: hypothetical protein E5Y88_15520 [Mesorhizobium sp.]|uniref:hypothetical protein n=1 Tax=Mesorhizobium sp. TaxID=1871066 RepID=UPI000FE6EFD9|nr:hypothetical protein [Mesorhizobium sp.]RWN68216.1 MAG: hypothetical protein EOR99_07585 [Mesorhizobium sp.]RWQ39314.1 MAG: hypothetical protein EOS20_05990 [Mesorhizobium sp.]TIL25043.1 MAG: hypothetical protein E5Y88_15520 [Mesorhizobium sp.]